MPPPPGSSGPGSNPDRDIIMCSRARHFIILVPPLYTHVFKWVQANLMLVITLRWTSTPSRGSRNTHSHFIIQKQELGAGLMGNFVRMQTDFT